MPTREKIWLSRHRNLARHPLVRRRAAEQDTRIETAGLFGAKQRSDSNLTYIGWGYRKSGLWALAQAGQNGKRILFEDGLVRSLKPGYARGALYGLVEDLSGIYYDGSGKSDLVSGLEGIGPIGDVLDRDDWQEEAARLLDRFRQVGASKYNWFPGEFDEEALERAMPEPGVVVIDQTRGDAAITFGSAREEDFVRMLEAALEENPSVPIYLRTHPDHLYRKKVSCLPADWLNHSRVRVIPATVAPWQTFQRATRVYCVSSLLGLEAMIHDIPVTSFGCSFYSGWGLTDDRHPAHPNRKRTRSLLEVFQAAYGLYSRYFDPHSSEACGLGRILDHLEIQKEHFRQNARRRVVFGMHPWKRPIMERFLRSPAGTVRWARSRRKAESILKREPEADVVVWGRQEVPSEWTGAHPIIRTEDGFIRSAGLGAEFHEPLSLVFDDTGIYYDSRQPSELESILATSVFSDTERRASGRLIDSLKSAGVTKYNLSETGNGDGEWPRDRQGAVRILVPGQVEADASIEFGCSEFRTNAELLQAVRERNPDAVIAYKPHPDIVKRVRDGRVFPERIETLCDFIITDLKILPWIESCDAVHTLTSLSGFEALLRGKAVACYGTPFYAGWGLTEDHAPVPSRRNRTLTLEELVAGALIRYPRYANPKTGEFMTPAAAIEFLKSGGPASFGRPWHLRLIARLKRLVVRH